MSKGNAPQPKAMPRAIMLDEPAGWMENGVLRQFPESKIITSQSDIRRLIEAGAHYREVL